MDDPVRDVTEDEIAFFRENGWVSLPSLVDPEVTAELYAEALVLMKDMQDGHEVFGTERDVNVAELFSELKEMADRSELYASVVKSPTGSRNASRMLYGDRPIRLAGGGGLLYKEPAGTARGHGPTHFHQDAVAFPFDRTWIINSWTALHELTPEMGTLQFYSRSHRFGLMGRGFVRPSGDAPDMLRKDKDDASVKAPFHPWLDSLELTEPAHLYPGDTLMWHGLTLHGARPNTSQQTRIALSNLRFDAETLYTGAPYHSTDGLGLRPNEPLDHPNFPLITF